MVDIEKISESTWFKLTARGSMLALPVVLFILGVVATDWLGRVFSAQEAAFNEVRAQIADLRASMKDDDAQRESLLTRVVTLEVSQARGREERVRFQDQMLEMMQQINSNLSRLGERTAGLEAAINAMRDRAEANVPSSPRG